MRERDIERRHVQRVKRAGGVSYKFTSPQRRSVPDRLDLYGIERAARVVQEVIARAETYRPVDVVRAAQEIIAAAVRFTECKAPGKKPTRAQLREHERLRQMGYRVDVVSE